MAIIEGVAFVAISDDLFEIPVNVGLLLSSIQILRRGLIDASRVGRAGLRLLTDLIQWCTIIIFALNAITCIAMQMLITEEQGRKRKIKRKAACQARQ